MGLLWQQDQSHSAPRSLGSYLLSLSALSIVVKPHQSSRRWPGYADKLGPSSRAASRAAVSTFLVHTDDASPYSVRESGLSRPW